MVRAFIVSTCAIEVPVNENKMMLMKINILIYKSLQLD